MIRKLIYTYIYLSLHVYVTYNLSVTDKNLYYTCIYELRKQSLYALPKKNMMYFNIVS